MKTLTEIRNENESFDEGVNLRTVSAVTLVSKSNELHKRINSTKIEDLDLDKKLNLLSQQLLFNSLLTAQLGLMSKKRR